MRYAVYYAPAVEEQLHALAAHWLGRDAVSGEYLPRPDLLPREEHRALVASPARYGFHATLKAPFRLAAGATAEDVYTEVDALAGRLAAVSIPVISLRRAGRFFALVSALHSEALQDFGARVVKELDHLRGPATEQELRLRRASALSARQDAYLARWGYPYVLEEFCFHMTLTGPVTDERAGAVEAALTEHFQPVLGRSLTVDRLCVFEEPATGEPFLMAGSHLVRHPHGTGVVPVEEH